MTKFSGVIFFVSVTMVTIILISEQTLSILRASNFFKEFEDSIYVDVHSALESLCGISTMYAVTLEWNSRL